MPELTNDFFLISVHGTVLDGGDVRIAPPLFGEAAYSLETDEDVAGYAAEHGVALQTPDTPGVSLEDDSLDDFLLVDVDTGLAYAVGSGWQVVPIEAAGDADLEDPAAAAQLVSSAGQGAPTAPQGVLELEGLPYESVVSLS